MNNPYQKPEFCIISWKTTEELTTDDDFDYGQFSGDVEYWG